MEGVNAGQRRNRLNTWSPSTRSMLPAPPPLAALPSAHMRAVPPGPAELPSQGDTTTRRESRRSSLHPDDGHRELGAAANNSAYTLKMLPAPPVLAAKERWRKVNIVQKMGMLALPPGQGVVHEESDEWTEVLDPSTKRPVLWVERFE